MKFKKYYLIIGLFFFNTAFLIASAILAVYFSYYLLILSILSLITLIHLSLFHIFNSKKYKKDEKKDNEKVEFNNHLFLENFLQRTNQGYLHLSEDMKVNEISANLIKYGFDYFYNKPMSNFVELESKMEKIILVDGNYWNLQYWPTNKMIIATNKTNELIYKKITENFDVILKIKIDRESFTSNDKFIANTIANDIFKLMINFFTKKEGYFIENLSQLDGVGFFKISNRQNLTNLIKNLMKDVDVIIEESKVNINYSVGIGLGHQDLNKINMLSNEAMRNSELRGINQVSLKETSKPVSHLSTSNKSAPSSLLRILEFINNFYDKVISADYVYITTHKDADLDALGSSLALKFLIQNLNKNVKVLIDTMDNTTFVFYGKKHRSIKSSIIKRILPNDVTSKSVLFVTDTSSKNLLQQNGIEEFFDSQNIFIIDHHEENEEKINVPVENKLINNSSSSASELIVRIIKNFPGTISKIELSSFIANSLVAGIFLDTRSLTLNVNKYTFDSIAYLSDYRIDIPEVKSFIDSSKYDLNIFSDLIKNIEIINNKIISFAGEDIILESDEISKYADELLDFKHIDASFVISKTSEYVYKVSCRSNEKYNVQEIANKLGGGGKINASAISFDKTQNSEINLHFIKKLIINNL